MYYIIPTAGIEPATFRYQQAKPLQSNALPIELSQVFVSNCITYK
jgi:hypothetical protein